MLDKRAFQILDIVIGMTSEGESVVIEKSEILAKLGEDVDLTELDNIVEMLALNDMIHILYYDEKQYCITPRPKGRIAYEKRQQAAIQQTAVATEQTGGMVAVTDGIDENGIEIPVLINMKKLATICAVSSFIGGFFAALFAFIIARLF
ncbi:MAG TPA: hypothetical protein VJ903_05365 [Clostridia bacterium]|nr:hypothetical protein [Clostridia bacterium]